MAKSKKTKKKTKRKLAHPKLPMQRQLNLLHEGTHFDLRPMFDDLNKENFRGALGLTTGRWGAGRSIAPKKYSSLGTFKKRNPLFTSNRAWAKPSFPP